MRRLSKRETGMFAVTAVVIVAAVLVQFVLKPLFQGGRDIDSLILARQQKLVKIKQQLATAKAADEQYAKLLDSIGRAGPDGQEGSSLLARVEAAANEANVHLLNMQPQAVSRQKLVNMYAVELQLSGPAAAVIKFMYALQAPPDNFFINELNLEKNADASGTISGRVVVAKMRLTGQER